MSKVFKKIARVQEVSKIVHGVWTKDNTFLYSTYNHFKYLLPNGDKGILKSINEIRCPVGLVGNTVFSYDIEYNLHKDEVSKEECMFKLALSQNDIAAVKAFAKNKKTQGSAMISYLHKKNYPAVALSLTSELKSKFQLALKSGNLQTAYESAAALKSTECFEKLAEDALLQGCHSVDWSDGSWWRSGTKRARTCLS
jgi:coatomer protein complex subunit alpha (xenin)